MACKQAPASKGAAGIDILVRTAKDQQAWQDALAREMPHARIHSGDDAPPCDYAVLWKPPGTVFAGQPRLRAVFSLGAGVDGLLAMPTLPLRVPLVRMEDAGMADQMVELALHAALQELRQLRAYAEAQARGEWAPRAARRRGDFTVGVLGLGVLGGAVASALAAFGFDVRGWSRRPRTIEGLRCVHGAPGLDALLAASDLLVLCLPSTPDTARLVDRRFLARMRPGAALMNIARGELVDEDALVAALDRGELGAAYLDVFREEPLPPAHRLWSHPRVRITPHIAALTDVGLAAAQVAQKIRRFEAGLPVSGVVDRAAGY